MNLPFLKPSPVEYHETYTDPFTGRRLSHVYTLIRNSKLVPGVTTIGNHLAKDFLKFWSAKEAVKDLGFFDPKQTPTAEGKKRLLELHEAIKQDTPEQFYERLAKAKDSHVRKSTEAADFGTQAHDWMDEYVTLRLEKKDTQPSLPTLPPVLSAIQAFLEWESTNNIVWLANDTVVGSEEHEFGGRLDSLASINGIPTLVDFKTSSQISEDYFIQTAGYHLALKEMGVDFWQRLILRVPKDGKEFEALIVPTPIDLDTKAFLALREIQRWKSYIGNQDNDITDVRGKVKVGSSKAAA